MWTRFAVTITSILLGLAAACGGVAEAPAPPTLKTPVSFSAPLSQPIFEAPERVEAQVVNVVDGDTIDVTVDGVERRVRYIGIDTPETVHPTRGEEPYGKESSARNVQLVERKTVYLEKDVSETDQYGRLLRYVWLEDGSMVNATLVAEGYAQVATYPPDVKYADRLLELQGEARAEGRGVRPSVSRRVHTATTTGPGLWRNLPRQLHGASAGPTPVRPRQGWGWMRGLTAKQVGRKFSTLPPYLILLPIWVRNIED